MSKFAQKEETVEWKPSRKDAMDLSEKLALYTKKEINGKMQFPFELYLEKDGVLSFDQWGRIQVINPYQFKRMNEINNLRTWIEEKDQENLFISFPEERVAWENKEAIWRQDIRKVLNLFKESILPA